MNYDVYCLVANSGNGPHVVSIHRTWEDAKKAQDNQPDYMKGYSSIYGWMFDAVHGIR